MKRLSFLLLDANVVIQLFKLDIWDRLTHSCAIQLSRTVLDEARFYLDDKGQRVYFDLKHYEQSGAIEVIEVALDDIRAFLSEFDLSYSERLDPGEAESLAYLMRAPEETRICSADAIVFRVLGNMYRSEQGVSLEEVLQQAGLGRQVKWPFCKRFRETYAAKGTEERLHGIGLAGRKRNKDDH